MHLVCSRDDVVIKEINLMIFIAKVSSNEIKFILSFKERFPGFSQSFQTSCVYPAFGYIRIGNSQVQ